MSALAVDRVEHMRVAVALLPVCDYNLVRAMALAARELHELEVAMNSKEGLRIAGPVAAVLREQGGDHPWLLEFKE